MPEYVPTGREPDGTDRREQADYWTRANSGRWLEAVRLERDTGNAVCDSDPLKLHYAWCLARVGAEPRERFDREAEMVRMAFGRGELGLPDLVLVSLPDEDVLQRHRDADPSRTRRSFALRTEWTKTRRAGRDRVPLVGFSSTRSGFRTARARPRSPVARGPRRPETPRFPPAA